LRTGAAIQFAASFVVTAPFAAAFESLRVDLVPEFWGALAWSVIVLSLDEQKFLLQQANDLGGYEKNMDESLTGLAKQAYPGADAILSFSRVVFDDAHTRALVQVSSAGLHDYEGETMALHKFGTGWGVVRRHLERGETSGERVGDRCEPTDVPSSVPTISEVERLVGDAEITVNPTSSQLRKYAGTSHYRFVPVDTLRRFYSLPPAGDKRDPFRMKNGQRLAMVQVFDNSTGKPRKESIGSLDFFARDSARHTRNQITGGDNSIYAERMGQPQCYIARPSALGRNGVDLRLKTGMTASGWCIDHMLH